LTTAGAVAVTEEAVRSPAELIVAGPEVTLQVGVTVVFVPSLQAAVAVYVDVAPSFTDAAPLIAMLLSETAALTVRLTARVVFPVPLVPFVNVTVSL
jgi:hypothetical protein